MNTGPLPPHQTISCMVILPMVRFPAVLGPLSALLKLTAFILRRYVLTPPILRFRVRLPVLLSNVPVVQLHIQLHLPPIGAVACSPALQNVILHIPAHLVWKMAPRRSLLFLVMELSVLIPLH